MIFILQHFKQYLKTHNDENLRKWVSERLKKYKEYHARNEQALEEFKKQKPTTHAERIKRQREIIDENLKKEQLEDLKRILKENGRKQQQKLNKTLEVAIAWSLSPNTRLVMKQNSNPHIREIVDKNINIKKYITIC